MEPITPIIVLGGCALALGYLLRPDKKKQKARDTALGGIAMQLMANAVAMQILHDKVDLLLKERGIEYDVNDAIKKLCTDGDCSSGCSCDGESKSI